jgi:hypothetical protein
MDPTCFWHMGAARACKLGAPQPLGLRAATHAPSCWGSQNKRSAVATWALWSTLKKLDISIPQAASAATAANCSLAETHYCTAEQPSNHCSPYDIADSYERRMCNACQGRSHAHSGRRQNAPLPFHARGQVLKIADGRGNLHARRFVQHEHLLATVRESRLYYEAWGVVGVAPDAN